MESINHFVNNDPFAPVLASFLAGLLFSAVSFGIVYLIIFLIIWEIFYFGYLDVNDRKWSLDDRVLVIFAALLGFLVGRFFHDDDDHGESFTRFHKDMNYYGEQFGWVDK